LIACLVFLALAIIIMAHKSTERHCEFVSNDQGSFLSENERVVLGAFLVIASTVFLCGATLYDAYMDPVHYTTSPKIDFL
jgi:hypothetical protein